MISGIELDTLAWHRPEAEGTGINVCVLGCNLMNSMSTIEALIDLEKSAMKRYLYWIDCCKHLLLNFHIHLETIGLYGKRFSLCKTEVNTT